MFSMRGLLKQGCVQTRNRFIHVSCTLCGRNQRRSPETPSQEILQELLDNSTVGNRQRVSDDKWLKSPFKEANIRDQAAKVHRPKVNPQETTIILFPGQGVQYVGMGKSLLKLPQVETMYKCASEILGYDLLKLCLNGPKNELDLTVYCQPAIYVASLACLQLMLEERQSAVESCYATAGFSVGEYAALVLANSLTFESGLKLVKQRAEAMQLASEKIQGGMMTLFLEPAAKIGDILSGALDWCQKNGVEAPVCSVANYMFPQCRVVAGNVEALRFIAENSKALQIRRCRNIPVSGAFHSALMKPAVEAFATVLKKSNIADPEIAVHSNVDGLPYKDAKDIKKKLLKQMYLPVKWEQTLRIIYERKKGTEFPRTFELGPGKSLAALLAYANGPASKHVINICA